MTKYTTLTVCFLIFLLKVNAQSLAINTDGSNANISALLDVKSTDKGLLIPRMNKGQRNTIGSPATGLLIFQNAPDSIGFYYYNGTSWLWMATASDANGWLTTGNSGTDTSVNFIGTTDNMPLRFKQNNVRIGQLDKTKANYFFGTNAGQKITTGISNIGIGDSTLLNNTNSNNKIAIGNNALQRDQSSNTNIAIGKGALTNNILGSGNIAIGTVVMTNNVSGKRNTAIGDSAMFTQSFLNGGVDYDQDNTAIGSKALFFNQPTSISTGAKNTAIGSEALYLNTTGQANTAVGTGAMHDNTTGFSNTAVGRSSNRSAKSGSFNSYLGFEAGYSDSVSIGNTGIGAFSLRNNISFSNTAVGYQSLSTDTTGNSNTSIGSFSGNALKNGSGNFFGGAFAGANINSGNNNIAIGLSALAFGGGTQDNNVAIGFESLTANTATGNTAVGYRSLRLNSSGIQNTALGLQSLSSNTTGLANTAVGNFALGNNSTGQANTGIGASALVLNTIGTGNTAVGSGSLSNITTGNLNTGIGDNAGGLIGNLINSTAIGARARVDTSNAMVLGSINGIAGAVANTSVAIGTTKPAPSAVLDVTSVDKGMLIPRMNKTQRNAIASPATGLLVFQNAPDSIGFYYYGGSAWLWIQTATSTNGWLTTGNVWTDTSVNFIGTTDNEPLRFRLNNEWSGQFDRNKLNYFIGLNTGKNNATGTYNTAVGAYALNTNFTGSRNVALGDSALSKNLASNNTAIGFAAAAGNTTGTNILAIGDSSLYSNTNGINNLAIGSRSLRNNIDGSSNIAIGKNALSINVRSSLNIAIGEDALANMNSSGLSINSSNVAIGYQALENVNPVAVVLSGNQNTAIGTRSGDDLTTGYYNTFLGNSSGNGITTGFQNTIIGHTASGVGTGSQNTVLGASANIGGASSNATAIGFQALASASNTLVLGSINGLNGASATVKVGIGTNLPDTRFHVVKDSTVTGGTANTASIAIFENDNTGYIQLINPSNAQSGILSGNSSTSQRSAIMFNADSSMQFRAGGATDRMIIDNTGFVGIRTATPTSYMDVAGSTGNAISVSSASQILDELDHTHVITNTAGAITITLPAANICSRREYVIVNQDNTAKTITSYLDFTGVANTSVPANNSITLQSNGANWYRIR